MRLRITHRTEYKYGSPIHYALQRIRLIPASSTAQTVQHWTVTVTGAREEVRFGDQFGNETRLLSAHGEPHTIVLEAAGEVETFDKAGVYGVHRGFAPLWLFRHHTVLTTPGDAVRALVATTGEGSELERLHALKEAVGAAIAYTPGATHTATTAEEALAARSGVCQDHAHAFIAAARVLGFPARYVSGYLMMEEASEQAASHAWAEAHVASLGWVAFDAANGISPDARYVRLAVGRDYRDAMPVSGILLGQAEERLAVQITVEQ
ncbi:MAG: transglutaminase domain-containing protein [Rhizobiaceae bacterium]